MSSQFATGAVSWQIYTQPWCDNNVTAQTAGKWAPNLLWQKYLSFAHKWGVKGKVSLTRNSQTFDFRKQIALGYYIEEARTLQMSNQESCFFFVMQFCSYYLQCPDCPFVN